MTPRLRYPAAPKSSTGTGQKVVVSILSNLVGLFSSAAIVMVGFSVLHGYRHSVPAFGYWFCWFSPAILCSIYNLLTYRSYES